MYLSVYGDFSSFFFFFWQSGMMAKFVCFYICKVLKFYICFLLYIIIGIKANIQPTPHCLALPYSLLENFSFRLPDIKLYLSPCWLFLINWLHCAQREILIFRSMLTKQRIFLASKRKRLNFHFKNLIEKSHTNTIDQHSCRNQPSSDWNYHRDLFLHAFWTQNYPKTFHTAYIKQSSCATRNLVFNTSFLGFKFFHLILYSVFHKQQPFVVHTIFRKLILNIVVDGGIWDTDMASPYFLL